MHVIMDARKLGEKEEAHRYLKEVFSFPDYYGANLDALYDCLSEREWIAIYMTHAEEAGPYYQKVLSVFEDLENTRICH